MEQIQLETCVQPRGLWNTHIDCLQVVADVASRDLDIVDIAGITGLGFRTALCAQAIPPSTYLSWSFPHAFDTWLGLLGLESQISNHRAGLSTYSAWVQRSEETAVESLNRGYPSIYWDNLGFGLVTGAKGSKLVLTGIPAKTVHPVWHDHQNAKQFSARLVDTDSDAQLPEKQVVSLESIANPSMGETSFIASPLGVCSFDPEQAYVESLYYICNELSGRIEYPRLQDNGTDVYEPQFGTNSMERLWGGLEGKQVHDFGLIQFVQVTAEARGLAYKYLKRLSDRLDVKYKGRLDQAAEFFMRTIANWGKLKRMYDVPLNRDEQMRTGRLIEAREQLYQIKQTETTAGRLLKGIASELFEL